MQEIIDEIQKTTNLKEYKIKTLIEQSKMLGEDLMCQKLKTNQIRKFLDAMNYLKTQILLARQKNSNNSDKARVIELEKEIPDVYSQLILLKPKLAYASVKKNEVKPLKEVMDVAIDKVKDSEDFERLFQFIESIIAYHKAAGGE